MPLAHGGAPGGDRPIVMQIQEGVYFPRETMPGLHFHSWRFGPRPKIEIARVDREVPDSA